MNMPGKPPCALAAVRPLNRSLAMKFRRGPASSWFE